MNINLTNEAKNNISEKQQKTINHFNKEYNNSAEVMNLVSNTKLNPIQVVVRDAVAEKNIAFLSLKDISGMYLLAEFTQFNADAISQVQKDILIRRTNVWLKKIEQEQEEGMCL